MNTIIKNYLENIDKTRVSSPIHQSRFLKLEHALSELFLKELNSKDSIFIKVEPAIIKKAAMFFSKMVSRPVSIGICGETACGKSTIVLDSMETIENFAQEFLLENLVTRINTDDYYFDRSEEVQKAGSFAAFAKNYDLDIPQAIELSLMKEHIQQLLNNKEVFLPKYDMSGTAKRFDKHKIAKPCPIIISEGVFTLTNEIADIFDFKIYVDIEKSIQRKRFFERAEQRGLGDSAERIFENANEKAQIYIKPCAQNADIIINGAAQRDKFKQFISSFLLLIEEVHYSLSV